MQLSQIQNRIYEIRGFKVILDFDLAALYDVETKRLKEAVRRNFERFPADFMFLLTSEEYKVLRTQIASLVSEGRGKYAKYPPFAFTEQGVAMLSSVLNSTKAIEVNISIMRTFVLIRQHALNYKELQEKLLQLEKKYNKNFKEIYHALNLLLEDKESQEQQNKREPIGFKTKSSK
jgi:hypothetical protein